MTSTLDTLLQRPEALVAQLVPTLIDSASGVTIDDLVVTTPLRGQTIIVPSDTAYAKPGWSYYGHAVATYQALDFSDVFGNYELRLLVSGPCNSTDLAVQLAAIFEVALTAADVIAFDIPVITPGMTVVLRANPDSLMWTGQRTLRLYLETIPYPEI